MPEPCRDSSAPCWRWNSMRRTSSQRSAPLGHHPACSDSDSVIMRCPQAIVDGLGGVLLRFPFRVPAYYALILRSLTVLEGLALQADARYKLLGKAYPYIARRLLTDAAPELRCVGTLELRCTRMQRCVMRSACLGQVRARQCWVCCI